MTRTSLAPAGDAVADEPPHVVVHPPPLGDGRGHGGEAVVGEHEIGRLLGHLRAAPAHRHADVGRPQRRRVVDAVARHRDDVAGGPPAGDEAQLALGLHPGQHVFLHGMRVVDQPDGARDRRGGTGVVPGDEHRPDTGAVAGRDRRGRLRADGVVQRHQPEEPSVPGDREHPPSVRRPAVDHRPAALGRRRAPARTASGAPFVIVVVRPPGSRCSVDHPSRDRVERLLPQPGVTPRAGRRRRSRPPGRPARARSRCRPCPPSRPPRPRWRRRRCTARRPPAAPRPAGTTAPSRGGRRPPVSTTGRPPWRRG